MNKKTIFVLPLGSILCLVLSLAVSASPGHTAEVPETPKDWVALSVSNVCGILDYSGLQVQHALPQSWLLEEERRPSGGPPARIKIRLALPGGDELLIEARLANGQLRQFRSSYFESEGATLRPRFQAIADGNCVIRSGRHIRREEDPWVLLDQLDGDLETLRWTETLQAPWPEGAEPAGPRVALVDSGLAYDLSLFRERLARDQNGDPIGYDFWDMDPWPYDGETSRGAFLPIRHGTAVASVLAMEAPNAALVPFRYPRPDMGRMAEIVKYALDQDIKILAMPLGSNSSADWTAFGEAISGQDILAIVSAGNNGRDIDETPVYPAGLDLDNILTVTSADGFGRLAQGSNWGRESVDIMLPAENVPVQDFRGASGTASGSSYAVPRLAALAARILDVAPELSALELKSRILERAVPSPFETGNVVAAGWIPDPDKDAGEN